MQFGSKVRVVSTGREGYVVGRAQYISGRYGVLVGSTRDGEREGEWADQSDLLTIHEAPSVPADGTQPDHPGEL